MQDNEYLGAEKEAILQQMLALAPFEGWTDSALKRAAKAAGFDDFMLYRAFPGGIKEAVSWFMAWVNREQERLVQKSGIENMRIRERISYLIKQRLEVYAPHKEAIRRLVAFLALPLNAGAGFKALYEAVDVMWRLAGDKQADYNYYTKRATLAGVYSSTLLYWLNDDSEGSSSTHEFLARRIEEVMKFEKFKGDIRKKMGI